jgi:hypothetical protein
VGHEERHGRGPEAGPRGPRAQVHGVEHQHAGELQKQNKTKQNKNKKIEMK